MGGSARSECRGVGRDPLRGPGPALWPLFPSCAWLLRGRVRRPPGFAEGNLFLFGACGASGERMGWLSRQQQGPLRLHFQEPGGLEEEGGAWSPGPWMGSGVPAAHCAVLSCQREEAAAGSGGASYITCTGYPSGAHSPQALFPARQPAPGWGCWAGAWQSPPPLTTCVWNVQMFPWGLQLAPKPRPASGLGSRHPRPLSSLEEEETEAALGCRTGSRLVWGLCFLSSKSDGPRSHLGTNAPDMLSPGPNPLLASTSHTDSLTFIRVAPFYLSLLWL